MTTSLTLRAMLADLTISMWSARRHDKTASAEITEAKHAAAHAARVNKLLVPKGALQPVETAAGEARRTHRYHTLPWDDGGARILTVEGYWPYLDAMSRAKERFDAAVDEFLACYPEFRAAGQRDLGDLFSPIDYPSPRDLRQRYGFETSILPLPDAADFRVELGDAHVEEIRADIERRTDERVKQAVADAWSRVHDVTAHMVERLTKFEQDGRGGYFRDTLVSNVRDLASVLGALNLTGDPVLERVRQRLALELGRFDPSELRSSPAARAETKRSAESILTLMAGYTGVAAE